MRGSTSARGADPVLRVQRKVERWRAGRRAPAPMPEGLWREAAELGLAHGFGRVAKTLGLDYNSLKKRAASVARAHDGAPDFVEILRGGLPMRQPECTIEMDDGTGAKLRIHLAGPAVPDLAELSRSFWEGQR